MTGAIRRSSAAKLKDENDSVLPGTGLRVHDRRHDKAMAVRMQIEAAQPRPGTDPAWRPELSLSARNESPAVGRVNGRT